MRFRFFLLICLLQLSSFGVAQPVARKLLNEIIRKGRESNSDGLIIIKNDKIICEEYYGNPVSIHYLASAGKSLTALAIGRLQQEGKIKSLDQPVSDFYPEWKQGQKKEITIRMLLNHTSGMQNVANASVELEPAPNYRIADIVQLALCAELSDKPGIKFDYNNKAVALLGGIIEKAAGKRMDVYFKEAFYDPMHITAYDWIRDEKGNPTAHGAFILSPKDFAKFGLLMLHNGIYENKPLLSKSFIEEAFNPGQEFDKRFGLLWWRWTIVNDRVISQNNMKLLQENGLDPGFIEKLKPLVGIKMTDREYIAVMSKVFGPGWGNQVYTAFKGKSIPSSTMVDKIISEEAIAYYATGYRGNYLVIIPDYNVVAVRVKGNKRNYNLETDNFNDFVELVVKYATIK